VNIKMAFYKCESECVLTLLCAVDGTVSVSFLYRMVDRVTRCCTDGEALSRCFVQCHLV